MTPLRARRFLMCAVMCIAGSLPAAQAAAVDVQWIEDLFYQGFKALAREARVAPVIDAVRAPVPAEGVEGTAVTLAGKDLNLAGWNLYAEDQGAAPTARAITVTSISPTEIHFTVSAAVFPAAPHIYWLYLKHPTTGLESNRVTFARLKTDEADAPLIVESVPVSAGLIGSDEVIQLKGRRFGSAKGTLDITPTTAAAIDPATITWSDTLIMFRQSTTWAGVITMQVARAPDSTRSNLHHIAFYAEEPRIGLVSPAAGFAGERADVNGAGFTEPSSLTASGGALYWRQGALPADGLCAGESGGDTKFPISTTAAPGFVHLYSYDAIALTTSDGWLPGVYYLCVRRDDGKRSAYERVEVLAAGAPLITAVTPNSGPYDRTQTAHVTGKNFGATPSFVFVMPDRREYAATIVSVAPDGASAEITTPLVPSPGPADVRINVSGQPAFMLSTAYTFISLPPPIITGLRPQYVRAWEGKELIHDSVYLTGAHFAEGDIVFVDGVEALGSVVVNDTTLAFPAPHHAPGTALVSVQRAGDPFTVALWGDDPASEPPLTFVHHALFGEFRLTWELPLTFGGWADMFQEAAEAGWSDILIGGSGSAYNPTFRCYDSTHTTRQWPAPTGDMTHIGTGVPDEYVGATWADVNNDGTLDVYVVRKGLRGQLFTDNPADADPAFSNVTDAWGLGTAPDSTAAAFLDYDRDGRVDVYLVTKSGDTNRLYRNTGTTFAEIGAAGVGTKAGGVAVAVADVDEDLFPDLFVVNPGGANLLYRNNQNGTFSDVTAAAGLADSTAEHTNAAFGDYDLDGHMDLYLAAKHGGSVLYHNRGDGTFERADPQPEEPPSSTVSLPDITDAAWADVDGDGDPELFLARHDVPVNRLFYRLQEHGGAWAELGSANIKSSSHGTSTSVAVADFPVTAESTWESHPGTPDFLVTQDDPRWYSWVAINTEPSSAWMRVRLQGSISNRAALGARLTLRAGGTDYVRDIEAASGNEFAQSFWFASPTTAQRLTIRWPSGLEEVLTGAALDALWNKSTKRVEPRHAVYVARGTVLGSLMQYDPMTGARRWSIGVGNNSKFVAPHPDGKTVFVVTDHATMPGKYEIVQVAVPPVGSTELPAVVERLMVSLPVKGLVVRPDGNQLVLVNQESAGTAIVTLLQRRPAPVCDPRCHDKYDFGAGAPLFDTRATQLLLDPSGRYAYVVNDLRKRLEAIQLDRLDLGQRTIAPAATGITTMGPIAFDAAGDHLYSAHIRPTTIMVKGKATVINAAHLVTYDVTGADPATATAVSDLLLSVSNATAIPWIQYDTVRHEVYVLVTPTTGSNMLLRVQPATDMVQPVPTSPAAGNADGAVAVGHRLWMIDRPGNVATIFNILSLKPELCGGAPTGCPAMAPNDLGVGPEGL